MQYRCYEIMYQLHDKMITILQGIIFIEKTNEWRIPTSCISCMWEELWCCQILVIHIIPASQDLKPLINEMIFICCRPLETIHVIKTDPCLHVVLNDYMYNVYDFIVFYKNRQVSSSECTGRFWYIKICAFLKQIKFCHAHPANSI